MIDAIFQFKWTNYYQRWKISLHATRFILLGLITTFLVGIIPNSHASELLFSDNFESDLSGWDLRGAHAIEIRDSRDAEHGQVLVLQPDGAVYALVKESDRWDGIRVEGEVFFPDDENSYFGLIYNFTENGSRVDFGELYLKGNGSYIRANPGRDGNVSRLLYEEYKTPLRGDEAIQIKKWHHFKAEIMAGVCHFYVGDKLTPKVTFGLFEHTSGRVGFKPRIVGGPIWIDNIKIRSIEHLSYNGPLLPEIVYEPDSLITEWEVIGPLTKPVQEIEWSGDPSKTEIQSGQARYSWKPFQVDARGAVITGRITEYTGQRTVAYFRTILESETPKTVVLHFSSVDEIAIWVNGRFNGFVYRDGYISTPKNDWNAWYDFWKNPEHAGRKVPVELKSGANQIVLRVRNGQFASGGFFLRLESD